MGNGGTGGQTGQRTLLLEVERILRSGGLAAARREGEILLCHRLGISRAELYINVDVTISPGDRQWLREAVEQRLGGSPLQYITGDVEFMGLSFDIDRRSFIPRPETEVLVETVISQLEESPSVNVTILDIGTGSGVIAIVLAVHLPGAGILASDISSDVLDLARANARRHMVEDRITFSRGDLFAPFDIPELQGAIDIIISNPPYIVSGEMDGLPVEISDHEPRQALDGGPDGLSLLRRLVGEGLRLLKGGGMLALEIGERQAGAVTDLIMASGAYDAPRTVKDYAGKDRAVIARRKMILD
jgi:release factor glutamine methyltransferase